MLAGKYSPLLGAAAGAVLGAGGSLLGNQLEPNKKGNSRVATEALLAGAAGAIPGLALGRLPQLRQELRQQAPHATPQAINKVTGGVGAALSAALPIYAGVGGLIGGGVSNAAQAIGLPGYQQIIPDPEAYGSSNAGY